MKQLLSIGVALLTAACCVETGRAANMVSPKAIIELQPQAHELGDFFADATVTQMLNRDYTHLANLYAFSIGGVAMQTLGSWLETSGYGVLQYGAHGSADGDTGGETFATFAAADAQKIWLVELQYFTDNELTILVNPTNTIYMLAFTKTYTDNSPAGSDVAFIASCGGATAGDFNASCKVAPGICFNTHLAASFNCVMAWLLQPAYRTLDLAVPKCAATMQNFVYTVSTNCDWQFFPFQNPAADVHGLDFQDGVVTFKVGSEPDVGPGATSHYEIVASPKPRGPWTTVGPAVSAGAGRRAVHVGDTGPFIRLVEVEKDGDRIVHGSARADATAPISHAPSITASDRWARYEKTKSDRIEALGNKNVAMTGETVVAYVVPALVSVVETEIAGFWSALGATVNVVSTAGFPTAPASFRAAVKSDIATRVAGGADAVLFVGDANDHIQFTGTEYPSLWLPANGWENIRQNYLNGGYVDQSSRDGIPTFYMTDTDARGANMGYVTPYWMSDWPYVDVDDDELPDVPIARLPFTTTDEVYGYASKLWESQNGELGATTVGLFAGDDDFGGNTGAEVIAALTDVVDATPGVLHTWLYETDYPAVLQRNAATVDLWNSAKPEIVFILGTLSNRSNPGGFFDQTVNPPFTMNSIEQSHAALVVALSCGGANFAQTEDSDYGRPIAERFLAEWYKGAIAWVGPTVGSWQHANVPLTLAFAEELWADPARPVASSFLVALRRVLTEHADEQDIVRSSLSTTVLGDPLARVYETPIATAIDDTPHSFAFDLDQNQPNPFNPVTRIRFDVPERGAVTLQVFDVRGRLITTLANRVFDAGSHTVVWGGKDDQGTQVASGMYFYRLHAGDHVQSRKMVLLK